MATVSLGALALHTNSVGWQQASAQSFDQGIVSGESYPATVTGPAGLELDLEIFISSDGQGMVHCPSPFGVPADYARLAHGARLGVYREGDDLVIRQLRLLRFSASRGWGNPTQTTWQELDELLGSSSRELFQSLGASEVGKRSEVLGYGGNDLAIRWSADNGPELPLAAYVLTRVLAILEALKR